MLIIVILTKFCVACSNTPYMHTQILWASSVDWWQVRLHLALWGITCWWSQMWASATAFVTMSSQSSWCFETLSMTNKFNFLIHKQATNNVNSPFQAYRTILKKKLLINIKWTIWLFSLCVSVLQGNNNENLF